MKSELPIKQTFFWIVKPKIVKTLSVFIPLYLWLNNRILTALLLNCKVWRNDGNAGLL